MLYYVLEKMEQEKLQLDIKGKEIRDASDRGMPVKLQIRIRPEENLSCYLWPGRETVISGEDLELSVQRGYFMPFSFLTFIYEEHGYTLISETDFLRVGLQKRKKQVQVELEYPADTENIKILFYRHEADWHKGIAIYRSWYRKYFTEKKNRRADDNPLKNHYHIKRYFLHNELCEKTISSGENYNLTELWKSDHVKAGVDTALFFDHAFDQKTGIRCGNEDPMAGVERPEELKKQIQKLREQGVVSFAYFDPYLVEEGSSLDRRFRETLPVMNSRGEWFRNWGPVQWHPCLSQNAWKQEVSDQVKRAVTELGTDGIYLDEVGNGTQYHCHNRRHAHDSYGQNGEESEFAEECLKAVPGKAVICEFPPSDRMANLINGALNDATCVLDLYRFCFSEMKVFRMINCDRPVGNNRYEVNKAFFNGEGLWLDNDLENRQWYTEELLEVVKKQYDVLKKYTEYFESEELQPLAEGTNDRVWINRFGSRNNCVYTVINHTEEKGEARIGFQEKKPGRITMLYKEEGDGICVEKDGIRVNVGKHSCMAFYIE